MHHVRGNGMDLGFRKNISVGPGGHIRLALDARAVGDGRLMSSVPTELVLEPVDRLELGIRPPVYVHASRISA